VKGFNHAIPGLAVRFTLAVGDRPAVLKKEEERPKPLTACNKIPPLC